jgi:hypothetical protein
VVVTGALEPSYDIGGDAVDHAVDGAPVDLVVLDAVGTACPRRCPATRSAGRLHPPARRGRAADVCGGEGTGEDDV